VIAGDSIGDLRGIEMAFGHITQCLCVEGQQPIVVRRRALEAALGLPTREIRGLSVHRLQPAQPPRFHDPLRARDFAGAESHMPNRLHFAPHLQRGRFRLRRRSLGVQHKHADIACGVVPRRCRCRQLTVANGTVEA